MVGGCRGVRNEKQKSKRGKDGSDRETGRRELAEEASLDGDFGGLCAAGLIRRDKREFGDELEHQHTPLKPPTVI